MKFNSRAARRLIACISTSPCEIHPQAAREIKYVYKERLIWETCWNPQRQFWLFFIHVSSPDECMQLVKECRQLCQILKVKNQSQTLFLSNGTFVDLSQWPSSTHQQDQYGSTAVSMLNKPIINPPLEQEPCFCCFLKCQKVPQICSARFRKKKAVKKKGIMTTIKVVLVKKRLHIITRCQEKWCPWFHAGGRRKLCHVA